MGTETIERVSVAPERFGLWGVTVNDYKINGQEIDFETIITEISAGRATTIEGEVEPLNTQVTNRNKELENLGTALAEITGKQSKIKEEERPSAHITLEDSVTREVYDSLGLPKGEGYVIEYSRAEQAVQLIKTKMDKLNNDAQSDMTRLQSLVSKRDESFTTATTIMTSVSDTRGNLIKAIGG